MLDASSNLWLEGAIMVDDERAASITLNDDTAFEASLQAQKITQEGFSKCC